MASTPLMPPARHIEYRKGGWGAAILTLVATAAVFLGAWAIHARTYREATDVMMVQRGNQPETHGAAADHGEAGGAHGATPVPNAPATGAPEATRPAH